MRLNRLLYCVDDRYQRHSSSHGRYEQDQTNTAIRHRRERRFDAKDIRLLILYFLDQDTAHGYELIKLIDGLSKGEYIPSPGIIYPNLALLEEMGSIRAINNKAEKKAWQLTEEGRELLNQQQDDLHTLLARLASLAILGRNRHIPEVQRAIHNFKVALNTKLSQRDIPQETLDKIIDILDQAAKDIERSQSLDEHKS